MAGGPREDGHGPARHPPRCPYIYMKWNALTRRSTGAAIAIWGDERPRFGPSSTFGSPAPLAMGSPKLYARHVPPSSPPLVQAVRPTCCVTDATRSGLLLLQLLLLLPLSLLLHHQPPSSPTTCPSSTASNPWIPWIDFSHPSSVRTYVRSPTCADTSSIVPYVCSYILVICSKIWLIISEIIHTIDFTQIDLCVKVVVRGYCSFIWSNCLHIISYNKIYFIWRLVCLFTCTTKLYRTAKAPRLTNNNVILLIRGRN